jgi:molybdate transport system substrate-binding protein
MINNQTKILGFISISILSSLLINGCDKLSNIKLENPTQASQSIQLTVSAAASLKDVIDEIQPLYQKTHHETEIIYNFGSSGSLQQQIEQGAPVDIFISAAPKQMSELAKKGLLLTETRQDLLKNQINRFFNHPRSPSSI